MRRTPALIAALAAAAALAGCGNAGSTTAAGAPSSSVPNPAASASLASQAAALRSAQAAVSSAIASASASPSPRAPAEVQFIVTGTAPGGIDITYGPSGSDFAGPSALYGKAVMSVKFDPSASYYALTAQLQGAGSIRCKIVVTGPGDEPLTVSRGAASGGYNICSAQATSDDGGFTWQNEN